MEELIRSDDGYDYEWRVTVDGVERRQSQSDIWWPVPGVSSLSPDELRHIADLMKPAGV
jgi:hypothetical protein